MIKKILYIFFSLFLLSCVREPTAPNQNPTPSKSSSAIILCEGLWGYNNSSLDKYLFDEDKVLNNFFSLSNPGLVLGDIANSIALKGDTAFIAVTGSNAIEIMNTKTGKSLGRIKLDGNIGPRFIYILNDTLAYFTCIFENSIRLFNPTNFKLSDKKLTVGPAPEGIAGFEAYIFVVNSGYGDYFSNDPKSSTISVIDAYELNEKITLKTDPNPIKVICNPKTKKFYVSFKHLPSKKDSIGGLIEYDIETMKEVRRWRFKINDFCLDLDNNTCYAIDSEGVIKINLNLNQTQSERIITNPKISDIWYCVAYYDYNKTLWIGNAKNYQVNGEILIYEVSNTENPLKKFTSGINPNTIIFQR
ncbi:MAG: hypothetical protein N2319_00355 [Candidatus Kapabacteria bacterium]|nr:hypothetical protein [Candidatus Kapabacteria bacterium]